MNFPLSECLDQLYEFGHVLGNGQYATVRICTHRETNEVYAAKIIRKRRTGSSRRGARRSDIEREVAILREVGLHKNIVSLHNVYESPSDVVLLLEYASGGELFHHVCSLGKLNELEAKSYVKQILIGVSHLHSRHIVHLDLKPENIMLVKKCSSQIKIIDFGLSRKIKPTDCVQQMVGTPEFVAPEVVEYDRLSTATDMWAVGVITYILLSGMSPFMGENRDATFANITAVNYDFDDDVFGATSELAKDFIRKLFIKNPGERATCFQCLRHPWIHCETIEADLLKKHCAMNGSLVKAPRVRLRWQSVIATVILCNRIVKKRRVGQLDDGPIDETMRDAGSLMADALLTIAEEGNVPVLRALLQMTTFAVDSVNKLGQSALHVACGSGHLDVVNLLIKRGANASLADKHGDTPLFWAARCGQTSVIELLLDIPVSINVVNKCFESALHIATRYGHIDIAEMLVSRGCDVNAQDEHGETALHIACWHGYAQILELLLKSTEPRFLNLYNLEQECAIHCASVRGHLECVQLLLSAGAQVDCLDKNGQTPLSLAVRRHHADVALLLLHYNADFTLQDLNGDTVLHVACAEGQTSLVQTLCQMGCLVDLLNKASVSPLHIASKRGYVEIVRTLCLAGANINLKSKDGLTAENSALTQNFANVAELLAKLKNEQQRLLYIDQLAATSQTLRRIKVKLFGHAAVGKSKLVECFKTSFLGSLFRRRSECSSKTDESSFDIPKATRYEQPAHPTYTRGIEVHQGNIPNCGEFSIWDFGSYHSYHQVYDHFVGNTDCVHLIMFRISDPMETQYKQIVYWLNFLKCRILPMEPFGFAGKSLKPAYVALVGTHCDAALDLPSAKSTDGEWTGCEADAMLKTFMHRFSSDFNIHNHIFMINAQQASCPGLKLLKSYLSQCRSEILHTLPKWTGLSDAVFNHLTLLRKNCVFPVISWPDLVETIRKEINPLASEMHCKQVVQQLQLMGEVIYVKGEIQEFDFVILSPNWFCHTVLGTLLSAEFQQHNSPAAGCLTRSDLRHFFADVPIAELLQLLYALGLCTSLETQRLDSEPVVEFPSLIKSSPPAEPWTSSTSPLNGQTSTYGGLRITAAQGMNHMLSCIFPRIQVQLQRCLVDVSDSNDFQVQQWRSCTFVRNRHFEALVSLQSKERNAVQIEIRAPSFANSSAFYFLEDLSGIVEQAVLEMAPGLLLERHFLSPLDLANNEYSPITYSPAAIIRMQIQEKTTICSDNDESKQERFVDVVCMGSRDVAMCLTLGIDLPVVELSVNGRRELAQLLDPPTDPMGRDCSILALKLGVPAVLAASPADPSAVCSPTDHVLRRWVDQQPDAATIGSLIMHLRDLGRQDALDALYCAAPLYAFAPPEAQQKSVVSRFANLRDLS